ncbi:hypothetical protein CYMTET_49302 [Cymbomonas tetramitiformis]|uniref:Uncharacterized protein n=1 Tax=Cymbomonas tetramitiformis TaxID=36881 RepID=A0AAE0BQH3_9CHLO|nr:hypothetical protein CYMTET_49302 [Cymbomonas tetramitiformis]
MPWYSNNTVAVVTGANKGIGYEIAKLLRIEGLTVILTARDPEKGQAAVSKISQETARVKNGGQVIFQPLDITNVTSIAEFGSWLGRELGMLDILVNNAGMAYHGNTFGSTEAQLTIETNVNGTINLCEHLIPFLNVRNPAKPRIVNVCSSAGKLKIVREPLRARFQTARTVEDVKELMNKFVSDIDGGTHQAAGWPNTMYGVSKLGMAAYIFQTVHFGPEGRDPHDFSQYCDVLAEK